MSLVYNRSVINLLETMVAVIRSINHQVHPKAQACHVQLDANKTHHPNPVLPSNAPFVGEDPPLPPPISHPVLPPPTDPKTSSSP